MGVRRPGVQSPKRADVDDAAAGSFEVWMASLSSEERATRIGFKHRVPLFDGDVLERGGFIAAGVVDEDVEPAETGSGRFDRAANLGRITHIGPESGSLDSMSFHGGNRVERGGLRLAPGDRHMCSGFGEGEGDGAPDAFGGAGDDGDLILERARGARHTSILNLRQATFRGGRATAASSTGIQGDERKVPPMKTHACLAVAASLLLAACAGCAGNRAAGKAHLAAAAVAPDDAALHPNRNSPYMTQVDTPRLIPRATAEDAQHAGLCDPEVLSVEEIAGDANGAFRSAKLAFMNRGAVPCRLGGYPGVALVDADGALIGSLSLEKISPAVVVAELGRKGTVDAGASAPSVTLMPQAVAAFQVVWTSGPTCPSVSRILVTAPGTERAFSVSQPMRICTGRIQVTAVRLDEGDI